MENCSEKRAVSYLRVSELGQVDGDGFQRQREAIRAAVRRRGRQGRSPRTAWIWQTTATRLAVSAYCAPYGFSGGTPRNLARPRRTIRGRCDRQVPGGPFRRSRPAPPRQL